jgi:hypothetical protein
MYVNRDAPNQCEDFVDTQSPETEAAARRTVASYAIDADDARELMMALGIHPSQDRVQV